MPDPRRSAASLRAGRCWAWLWLLLIAFAALRLAAGRGREVHPLVYGFALVFLARYLFLR